MLQLVQEFSQDKWPAWWKILEVLWSKCGLKINTALSESMALTVTVNRQGVEVNVHRQTMNSQVVVT